MRVGPWLLLLLVALPALAGEDGKRHPIVAFTADARGAYGVCAMTARLGDPDGLRVCLDDYRQKMPAAYRAALKSAGTNKALARMLKDYYAFWNAEFDGVLPNDETERMYLQRTDETGRRLNERAIRIEIEAGLR